MATIVCYSSFDASQWPPKDTHSTTISALQLQAVSLKALGKFKSN